MNEIKLRQLFQNLSDYSSVVRIDGTPHYTGDRYESVKVIKTISEDRFIELIHKSGLLNDDTYERLQDGRDYLMGVQPSELTVEDALEAFGFNRNGLH